MLGNRFISRWLDRAHIFNSIMQRQLHWLSSILNNITRKFSKNFSETHSNWFPSNNKYSINSTFANNSSSNSVIWFSINHTYSALLIPWNAFGCIVVILLFVLKGISSLWSFGLPENQFASNSLISLELNLKICNSGKLSKTLVSINWIRFNCKSNKVN